jgi:hypothetical protein
VKENKAIENICRRSHHDGNTSDLSQIWRERVTNSRPGKWLFVTSYNLESRSRCFRLTGYLRLKFGTLYMDPAVSSETRYLCTKLHGVTTYTTFISILNEVMFLQNVASLARQTIVSKSIHSQQRCFVRTNGRTHPD